MTQPRPAPGPIAPISSDRRPRPSSGWIASTLVLFLAVALVPLSPGTRPAQAAAGDERWEGLGRNGPNDAVLALTVYQDKLIVAGFFTAAGDVPVAHIAAFDGQNWTPLGAGMDGVGVYSLTIYQGDLIAGGWFDTAGGVAASNIARWDGTSWTPIGSGTDGVVWNLHVYNGNLVAGGLFTTAGGVTAKAIAQWDGNTWSALGGGLLPRQGYAFGVFAMGDLGPDLIAGGSFARADNIPSSNIARWDGAQWHTMAGGTNGIVYAQTFYSSRLTIGGAFTVAGGQSADRLAGWDGSAWSALGSGVSGGNDAVDALAPVDSELILGGVFTLAGGRPAARIASWDGTNYGPLGSGANDAVRAFCFYGSRLYVGGSFDTVGTQFSDHLARWIPPQDAGVAGPGDGGSQPGGGGPAGSWAAASPNPFRGATRLRFHLEEASAGPVEVYDLNGRCLVGLRSSPGPAGDLLVEWDGRDALGRDLPPGVYLARLARKNGIPPLRMIRLP